MCINVFEVTERLQSRQSAPSVLYSIFVAINTLGMPFRVLLQKTVEIAEH